MLVHSKKVMITLGATALLLSGCATTEPQYRQVSEVNHQYVNAVDRTASRINTRVYWVNPPKRTRLADEDG